MSSASKKQGTRVFKKGSPNGKITVYLGKRDFVDHVTHVDPIDGVVLVDPEYLKDRKVYGHVLAAFRYGREDLDVLGLTFRKDLYLASSQIFPPLEDAEVNKRPLTRLQERLIKKLGANAYPFFFELPPHCPASVTLQPAPGDTGQYWPVSGSNINIQSTLSDDRQSQCLPPTNIFTFNSESVINCTGRI